MPFSNFRRVEWWAVLAAVAFAAAGWATWRAYADAAAAVRHTTALRREFALCRDALVNAQLGQRGYLLTGRDRYLDPYRDGRLKFDRHLERARAMSGPDQQDRLSVAAASGAELLAELDATVRRVLAGDKAGAYGVVMTDAGEGWRRAALSALDDCTAAEEHRLEDRAGRAEWLFRACLSAAALSGAAVALAALFAWRAYRRRPAVYVPPFPDDPDW